MAAMATLSSQPHHEPPPVMPRIVQQAVCSILFEWQGRIIDDSLKKVVPFKGQHEDGGKQGQGGCAPQFSDAALIHHGTDFEVINKLRNSVVQTLRFLLFPIFFGNIHNSPSFLILLIFLPKSIYHKVKDFSV